MKRIATLCLTLSLCASAVCTGPSPIACANNLDNAEFGFALVVPAAFECVSEFSTASSIATLTYRDTAASRTASVQINDPQNGEVQDGIETEDLGDVTNDQGFTFERKKVTLEGLGVSYVGGTTLGSGNILFITVSGAEHDHALLEKLDEIIATASEAS